MRSPKSYFVYMLASLSGTLYIGVTNDLHRRLWQHKQHEIDGFTNDYEVDRLVYYESFLLVSNAIAREKQLKGWRREKKIALIEQMNPQWKDLSREWYESRGPSTRPPKPGGLAQDDSGEQSRAGRGPSTRVSRAEEPAREPSLARDDSLETLDDVEQQSAKRE